MNSSSPQLRWLPSPRARSLATAVAFLLLAFGGRPSPLAAQVLYGSFVGTVTDETGAAVPGAAVTITHTETGASRDALASAIDGHVRAITTRIGRGPDRAILGCTHYEIVADLFREMLPPGTPLIADKGQAPIVPVKIDGLEQSPFTRLTRERARRRWWPKVTVTVLERVTSSRMRVVPRDPAKNAASSSSAMTSLRLRPDRSRRKDLPPSTPSPPW